MEVDEDNLLQGGKGVSNITDYVSKVCLSILSILCVLGYNVTGPGLACNRAGHPTIIPAPFGVLLFRGTGVFSNQRFQLLVDCV